ncbi:hypothetical protein [Mycoplasma seminis]|uniref:Uncharacterized protein n=1 Tax=Mycoplasma seminis TaxID=512749 RepID=A0ABY9HAW4_9MOLU|nr:hypothetical protein [Mycoplasma seminis]WLP85677.1 hypothetical protein Q8852_00770 [Mycoplasma seminis]
MLLSIWFLLTLAFIYLIARSIVTIILLHFNNNWSAKKTKRSLYIYYLLTLKINEIKYLWVYSNFDKTTISSIKYLCKKFDLVLAYESAIEYKNKNNNEKINQIVLIVKDSKITADKLKKYPQIQITNVHNNYIEFFLLNKKYIIINTPIPQTYIEKYSGIFLTSDVWNYMYFKSRNNNYLDSLNTTLNIEITSDNYIDFVTYNNQCDIKEISNVEKENIKYITPYVYTQISLPKNRIKANDVEAHLMKKGIINNISWLRILYYSYWLIFSILCMMLFIVLLVNFYEEIILLVTFSILLLFYSCLTIYLIVLDIICFNIFFNSFKCSDKFYLLYLKWTLHFKWAKLFKSYTH